MPRLAGKQSNDSLLYVVSFAFVAIMTVAVLEYMGAIDLVPNFGKSNKSEGAKLEGNTSSLIIRPNSNNVN